MSNFSIEVRPKKEKINLTFRTFKNLRGRYTISISDDKTSRRTDITFDKINTYVPSTLLSRWVNHFMRDKLLKLAGKGSSVEYIKKDGNTWRYRDNVQYFGLHDIVKANGQTVRVLIEDSIGMKKVVDILNAVGYHATVEFETATNRVKSISLEEL